MSTPRTLVRLLTGDRLRALRLAFRQEIGADDVVTDPDPALLELVQETFTSIRDAEDRLTDLERRLRDRDDRRAVFLSIYVRMTRRVREELASDRFANPAWMRQYLITFAEYYRRAFLSYEQGRVEAVPDPWRIAFGMATRGEGLIVQDAFLGINAHINYDLALAIRDVGIDPNREEKYRDHERINAILGHLVDAQQRMLADLYAPGIEEIDAGLGRLDETFTLLSMTEGREQAWRMAVILTDVDWHPVRKASRWVLDRTATGAAGFIRSPPLDPALMAAFRRFEQEQLDLDVVLEQVHRLAIEGP